MLKINNNYHNYEGAGDDDDDDGDVDDDGKFQIRDEINVRPAYEKLKKE